MAGDSSSNHTSSNLSSHNDATLSTSLQARGITLEDPEQAWNIVKDLPESDKAETIIEITRRLVAMHTRLDTAVLKWAEKVSDGGRLGFTGSVLEAYQSQMAELQQKVEAVNPPRIRAAVAKEKLAATLRGTSRRGQEFLTYVMDVYGDVGKNFFNNLRQLFRTKSLPPREAIRLLNMIVLQRNTKKTPSWCKSELIGADVENALHHVKQVGAANLEIDVLESKVLKQLDLSFGPSGILVRAPYGDEPFPSFDDEPDDWEIVVVSSEAVVAEPAGSGEGGGATEESALDDEEEGRGEGRETPKQPQKRRKRKATPDRAFNATRPPKKKPRGGPTKGIVVEMTDCFCAMPDTWKANLALWHELGFGEVVDVLRSASLAFSDKGAHHPVPCDRHLEALCTLLSLEPREDKNNTLGTISKIYNLVSGRTSVRLAWIHPNTRSWFLETPEIALYRERSRTGGRFTAVPVLPPLPPPEVSNSESLEDWDRLGARRIEDFFGWTVECGIQPLLVTEFEMLRWHMRSGSLTEDGLLRNGYFPLAVQLLWADPLVWLHFQEFSHAKSVHLVAHPLPMRMYSKGDVDLIFYEGDTGHLTTTSNVCAEVCLSGEGRDVEYVPPHNAGAVEGFLAELRISENHVDLSIDHYNAYKTYANVNKLEPIILASTASDMHMYQSGTIVAHKFSGEGKLTAPRTLIPLSYVEVSADGTCSSGVSYDVLQKSHASRTAPDRGRFRDCSKDKSCLASVPLEGVGALFDMVRCLKPIDHPAVRHDILKWRAYKRSSNHQILDAWRKTAAEQVRIAFGYLRGIEMDMFDANKSYFRCMEERLQPPTDDPEYIAISDNEEATAEVSDDDGSASTVSGNEQGAGDVPDNEGSAAEVSTGGEAAIEVLVHEGSAEGALDSRETAAEVSDDEEDAGEGLDGREDAEEASKSEETAPERGKEDYYADG